jgi:hypothetical protein
MGNLSKKRNVQVCDINILKDFVVVFVTSFQHNFKVFGFSDYICVVFA